MPMLFYDSCDDNVYDLFEHIPTCTSFTSFAVIVAVYVARCCAGECDSGLASCQPTCRLSVRPARSFTSRSCLHRVFRPPCSPCRTVTAARRSVCHLLIPLCSYPPRRLSDLLADTSLAHDFPCGITPLRSSSGPERSEAFLVDPPSSSTCIRANIVACPLTSVPR